METRLFPYIVSKASEVGVYVYAIDGWTDHIHLVVAIPPKRSVAEVVKIMKGASSQNVNQERLLAERFGWAEGYGVFTVGEKQRATAVAYVRNQKGHHRENSANAWLERTERIDDGPADQGPNSSREQTSVREEAAAYTFEADFPF